MIACDCHVHVFGPRDRYPQIDTRAYTAGVASVETLRRNANPLGISRFVVVQASVHGTDNSCLLDTLDALDGSGRGVVVVDPRAVSAATLDGWSTRGARGLRINLYSDYKDIDHAGPKPDGLQTTRAESKRPALRERFEALVDVAPDGWHIEVIAPLPLLADAAMLLAGSRVPVVIDHYGLPGTSTPDSDDGRLLLELVRQPHVWMKLSGPYRASECLGSDPLSTTPPAPWLEALIEAAPQRLVWGSDWPHTPAHEDSAARERADPFRPIDYGRMFGDFLMAVSEPRMLEAILDANPARLYGFV
ncbi:MAG TPA: amidohydrolase family protein [Vicinamibacterales bacterium]|nr:amidohydrolase family protein [Vicinamibacterales bacterium]